MTGLARALRSFGLLLAAPVACNAEIVALGRAVPDPRFGDAGRPVAGLNAERSDDDSPALTQDLLEIYFTSWRPGGLGLGDVYCARRRDRVEPFDPPTWVSEVSSEADEAGVAISRDGLTLWVGSSRAGGVGGVDIWQAERADREAPWSALRNLTELNSESDDLPRPPAEGERVMPFASRREDGETYQTYFAVRPSRDAAFRLQDGDPLSELRQPGTGMSGAFLTEDGLLLIYTREQGQLGDLRLAWRRTSEDPFLDSIPLEALDTPFDERSPWINVDQTRIFFASARRMNGLDIFATTLDLPRFE